MNQISERVENLLHTPVPTGIRQLRARITPEVQMASCGLLASLSALVATRPEIMPLLFRNVFNNLETGIPMMLPIHLVLIFESAILTSLTIDGIRRRFNPYIMVFIAKLRSL